MATHSADLFLDCGRPRRVPQGGSYVGPWASQKGLPVWSFDPLQPLTPKLTARRWRERSSRAGPFTTEEGTPVGYMAWWSLWHSICRPRSLASTKPAHSAGHLTARAAMAWTDGRRRGHGANVY